MPARSQLVTKKNVHVCKWCGVEVESNITCDYALCPGEGDYFCASGCIDKWNMFYPGNVMAQCTPRAGATDSSQPAILREDIDDAPTRSAKDATAEGLFLILRRC